MNTLSPEADKEISNSLLRQRRNLILISLVMPLFFLSGASVSEINIFGTLINIESQAGIKILIFIMYFYFLWRYTQYYREEERAKCFRSIRQNKLYDIEYKHFSSLLYPKSKCFDFKHYYCSFKQSTPPVLNVSRTLPDKSLDKRLGLFHKMRAMEIYGLDDKYENHYLKTGDAKIKLLDEELNEISKSWSLVTKQASDARSGAVFETNVEYNYVYLILMRFLTNLKFIIIHPYFTDYELPFIIAVISIILTIGNI